MVKPKGDKQVEYLDLDLDPGKSTPPRKVGIDQPPHPEPRVTTSLLFCCRRDFAGQSGTHAERKITIIKYSNFKITIKILILL